MTRKARWIFCSMSVALMVVGCGSSPHPCQETTATFNCGDCTPPPGGQYICQPGLPTAAWRAACETACSSTADQIALGNYFSCMNNIPSAEGACTSANEAVWFTNVGDSRYICDLNYAEKISSGCSAAFFVHPDGG
jgi:hypothetical protein